MEKTVYVINNYKEELITIVDTICAATLLVLPVLLVFVLCMCIISVVISAIKNL